MAGNSLDASHVHPGNSISRFELNSAKIRGLPHCLFGHPASSEPDGSTPASMVTTTDFQNEVLRKVANPNLKKTRDPSQLSGLYPVACEQLARVGGTNDGGYVVPLNAIAAAHALVSFGLSHDWTFERDFKQRNADAIVHCYDHTVSVGTAFQYSIGQLLRFFLKLRASYFRKIFTWIDYKVFFRADRIHFKQRIWRDGQNNSATIEDVFGRLPAECPVFVKMDIEGSEYVVLDDLLRHSKNIVAMVIEFHDVDSSLDLFNSFVEKIKREFYIVHIHGNNIGGLTPFNFPVFPEITFFNKRFFDTTPPPSGLNYPIPGLDRPNNPRSPDLEFEL